jgi:imidazoleglycerol-phosphate dehydratase
MTEAGPRVAAVERATTETTVSVRLDIDGGGSARIETGIRFLDHMLELFAHHGGFGLDVRAAGDLDVGGHHTVEDIGLALGQALREALGEKRGIRRFGFFLLPMDEALVEVAADLSGRPYFAHNFELSGLRVGDFDAELTSHFFQSLVNEAALTLHIRLVAGNDTHHIVEAVFKGVARALGVACERHGRDDDVPSTKGVL